MLSYRHAFHAGNHGDVLKHAVLTLVTEYLLLKPKPFVYVDTHAGAGRYDLQCEWAQKNREFETGILPLWKIDDVPEALRGYLRILHHMNPDGELRHYPGSPWLMQQLLRKQDKARLYELHNQEIHALQSLFAGVRNVKVEHADGLQALASILPPVERRALVLIDPSYEIKDDFRRVVDTLSQAYRRFPGGVYLLWYPVIQRSFITRLEEDLRASGMRDVLLAELCIAPDSAQGMIGAGVIAVNPPWTLRASLQELLPYLADVLGRARAPARQGTYRIETLAAE